MERSTDSEGRTTGGASQTLEKELRIKAIDSALEWSKQITTITTGALVLSGTFIKVFMDQEALVWKPVILVSWISMSVSIVFGLLYLGTLCSLLAYSAENGNVTVLDIYKRPGIWIALIHIVAFLVGLAAFVAFIFKNL